jgi:hypothetical protein
MFRTMTGVAAMALLLAVTTDVAEAHKSTSLHRTGVAVSARSHYAWGSYRNMSGFHHRPSRYAFAFARPTISSFPMPFTVLW